MTTEELTKHLKNNLNASPKTPQNINGYLYRKIILYPGQKIINLNFTKATSWSLNPLFAGSWRFERSNVRHILLRLPLNTPASKLYIGDTSKLLNSSERSVHYPYFAPQAEVIVAPMRLEDVQRRELPLGHITGINAQGQSIKRLPTGAPGLFYSNSNYSTLPNDRYYSSIPSNSVSKGIENQKTIITVIDVREHSI